jgi:hypothetical protein
MIPPYYVFFTDACQETVHEHGADIAVKDIISSENTTAHTE